MPECEIDHNLISAGVAKSDISTDTRDAAIHDRLFAKVLTLQSSSTHLIMVSLDAVAVGGICDVKDSYLPKLREKILNEFGINGRNVMVHATHTHPSGRILCDDDQQVSRTLDAIRRALGGMIPVRISIGKGCEERIPINRTLRLNDGRAWTIRQTNPCPPCEEVASLGPVDPDICVMRIDRLDGRPYAIIYNYACHPLVGVPGGGVTANYPGFASSVIENQLGHGAMAMFLQGAAGDVTEVLYKDVNRPRDAEPIGVMLGLSVLDALRCTQPVDPEFHILYDTVELPRRTDIPDRLAELELERDRLFNSLRYTSLNFKTFLPMYLKHSMDAQHPSDYKYRYLHEEQIGSNALREMDRENQFNLCKYMDNIKAMEKLARITDQIMTLQRHKKINDESGSDVITAEILAIRIGECTIITAPIELLTETGLKIKELSRCRHTMIAAFTNGYMHYGPPADSYGSGDYETTECFLSPEWEQLYLNKVKAMIKGIGSWRESG